MIGPGSDNDKLGTYWILYLFPVVPVEQMARLEVDQSWGPHGNLNISLLKSKMTFANWTRSFPMMTIHCTQSPLRVVVRKKRDLVGKIGSFSHIIPFFSDDDPKPLNEWESQPSCSPVDQQQWQLFCPQDWCCMPGEVGPSRHPLAWPNPKINRMTLRLLWH